VLEKFIIKLLSIFLFLSPSFYFCVYVCVRERERERETIICSFFCHIIFSIFPDQISKWYNYFNYFSEKKKSCLFLKVIILFLQFPVSSDFRSVLRNFEEERICMDSILNLESSSSKLSSVSAHWLSKPVCLEVFLHGQAINCKLFLTL